MTVVRAAVRAQRRFSDRRRDRTPAPVRCRAACLLAALVVLLGPPALARAAPSAVVAWGDNVSSQIGIGTSTLSSPLSQVTGLGSGVSAISARGDSSLALRSDGTVAAWGSNYFGQLGDGTTTDRATPITVSGLTNVMAVAAGETFSMALKSDGSVWAWGKNNWGQLGDGTTTDHAIPAMVTGLSSGVTAIAAGAGFGLALKSNGTVVAWGDNLDGQLGDGTTADRTGPVAVSGLTGVLAISAGSSHSLALIAGGAVKSWGNNDAGQLGNGDSNYANSSTAVAVSGLTSGVTAIAAGARHSLALKSDGSVLAWGWNLYGQLGDGTTMFAENTPQAVSGLTSGVTAIAAGGGDSLALKAGGAVVAWGYNLFGQLADGAATNSNVPVAVSGLSSGATAIAAGGAHNLALQPGPGPAPSAGPAPPVYPAQPPLPTPVAPSGLASPANVPATSPVAEWAHPIIAADPAQPSHLAVAYTDQNNCWLSLSTDGGVTWTSTELLGPSGTLHPMSVTSPGTTFRFCFNPSVAYGLDGTLFYLENSVAQGFAIGNMFLTASTNGGATFKTPQQIDLNVGDTTSFAFQGIGLAIDMTSGSARGTVYATWDRNDPFGGGGSGGEGRSLVEIDACNPAAVNAYLTGGSLACGTPVTAGPATANSQRFHSLAVGTDGRVYAAWLDDGEASLASLDMVGPYKLLVSSSSDHGQSFGAPTIAATLGWTCPFSGACGTLTQYPSPLISMAAGPSPGDVYVTLEGPRYGPERIVISASHDAGATWASRGIELAGGSADDQVAPQVAVAPSGRVDVAWYEAIPGPGSIAMQDVYAASSTDGGLTYSAPRKLDGTQSLYTNADGSVGTFGDDSTIGLVSSDAALHVAWVDNRRGTPVAPSKNDIFTSTITFPVAPPGGTPPPGPAGSVPPVVTGYGLTNSIFAVAGARTPAVGTAASARRSKRHKKGTTFKYTLSESATVRIVIAQRLSGRHKGKRCVAPTRRLRTAKRCVRLATKGALTRTSHSGTNKVAFSGRIGSRALPPGKYQAVLVATNAANQSSRRQTVYFTVVRR